MKQSLRAFLSPERLEEILAEIPSLRIAVLGDFFLDKYLVTDPALAEVSIETGLEARQVVSVRCSPGAAGTVTNNLSALGAGLISAFGVLGDDGEGYELRRELEDTRVDTANLVIGDRRTPTYMKPMLLSQGGERELERLDIKNRAPLPSSDEAELLRRLAAAFAPHTPQPFHALVVLDQVQERNHGVVTDAIRAYLPDLAKVNPSILLYGDSRVRIGEFRDVVIKPNLHEAAAALGREAEEGSVEAARELCRALASRTGRTVFLTAGDLGILVGAEGAVSHVPALPADGPIDIVGAGDSATAGIVSALCTGASPQEAAALGNLCAAVTIRKLGTTGTATPAELQEMFAT